jgi:hypothetical protein
MVAALLAGVPNFALARPPVGHDSVARGEGAAPRAGAAPVAPAGDVPSDIGAVRLGATAGLDLADGFTGFAVDPQASYTVAALGPRLHLEVAGHLGIAVGGATGYSAQYVSIVPAARLRYDLGSRLALYGEMGLGPFLLHTSLDNDLGSDTQIGAVLRFPIGLRYAVSRSLELVFEPAGLSMYFNTSGNKFHYSLLIGVLVGI